MSREKQILKLINEKSGMNNYGSVAYQIGVLDGVRFADETMIEKACNWLREQKEMVGISFKEDFIERFKLEMKKYTN